jgi:RHS repeat-associated protein
MIKSNIALFLLATSALASPALAQSAPTAPPPVHRTVDDYGVDLLTGQFHFSLTEAEMGFGEGAISLKRYWDSGFHDNWSNGIFFATDGTVFVQLGNLSDTFKLSGGVYVSQTGNGATLSNSLLYTSSQGTKIQYAQLSPTEGFPLNGTACPGGGSATCAIPLSVTKPNGTVFTINWDFVDKCSDPPQCTIGQVSYYRFRGVSSSAGYSFTVNYVTNNPGNFNAPQTNWYIKTGATFANSVTACDTSCPSVTYSTSGGVTTITDALGRAWQLTQVSQLSGIRRPGETSDSTTVTYGTGGVVVSSVAHDGVTLNYSRTVAGNVSTMTVTDPLSHSKVITGDLTKGQITSVKDELNRTTSYGYDTQGRLTSTTNPEGDGTTLVLDARGNATQVKQRPKTGSASPLLITTYTYPSSCTNQVTCNKPTQVKDPANNITTIAYNATHGGVTTVTRPAPTTGAVQPQTRVTYTQITSATGALVYMPTKVSACQTLASCTNALDESKVSYAYNSNLLPTTATRANGTGTVTSASSLTYDPAGNLKTVDGPLSGTADTTRYRYDADRELIGVTSPDPDGAGTMKMRAIRVTYRGDGQVSKQELGTVNSQSDPDWALFAPLQTIDIGFDTNARPITQTLSASGTTFAITRTNYDALGRVNCTAQRMNLASDPTNACTLGTVGSFGSDRIAKAIYDNASQLTQVQVGVGTTDAANERTLTYSNDGDLATLKDAENNLTTYEYDEYDRPLKTRYPNPTKGSGTSSTTDYEQVGYDTRSNVTSFRNRAGETIGFTRDNLNRVTLKDLPGTEPDVTYGYDNLNRLTSATQTGNALSFGYDALSRKTSEGGANGTTTFAYDAADEKTGVTYSTNGGGSALTVNYAYLLTGELDTIKQSTTTLADYSYDNLGNRTGVTYEGGTAQAFGYDPVSRLASLTNDLSGTTNDLSVTFGYNPASQIIQTVRTGDAYAFSGYANQNTAGVANGLNQLTSVGGANASYDSKGNLTSDPISGKAYGYSSENLLTSGSGSVSAAYDPMTRLAQIIGSATTNFAYDGTGALAEYDGGGALQRRFVFDPTTGQPVVQYEGAGFASTDRRYLSTDERGSVISVVDGAGTLIGLNAYDEYGIPRATNVGRFQYTGQRWLSDLSLYDYKARMYSPGLGRFVQTDPNGYYEGPNVYNYVLGDPVNLVDPLGLCAEGEVPVYDSGSRLPRCVPKGSGDSGGVAPGLSPGLPTSFLGGGVLGGFFEWVSGSVTSAGTGSSGSITITGGSWQWVSSINFGSGFGRSFSDLANDVFLCGGYSRGLAAGACFTAHDAYVYGGITAPGPEIQLGYAPGGADAYVSGLTVSGNGLPGFGISPTTQAYAWTVGTPLGGATYAVSVRDAGSAIGQAINGGYAYFSNLGSVMSRGFYDMAGRPYGPR